ncbi:hypothetical protein Tco_0701038 [Tanacetum coccineum]
MLLALRSQSSTAFSKLPTTLLPGYVTDFDPLEEDLEEDPKEDLAEYLADGGDDDDEDEDDDDDDEDDEEDEEEEEHLGFRSNSYIQDVEPAPQLRSSEAFKTDESAPTPPSPRSRRAKIFI